MDKQDVVSAITRLCDICDIQVTPNDEPLAQEELDTLQAVAILRTLAERIEASHVTGDITPLKSALIIDWE